MVKGSAPLLVSRPALKRLGATINFAYDRLKLFHDRLEMPLHVNSAGQYMVDVMQFAPCVPAAVSMPVPKPASVSEPSDLSSEVTPPVAPKDQVKDNPPPDNHHDNLSSNSHSHNPQHEHESLATAET